MKLSNGLGQLNGLRAKGDTARDAKQWLEAVTYYEQFLKLRPSHFDILVQLGNCSKEAGLYEKSLAAYERAEQIRSDDADLFIQIGHLLKVMGKKSDALEAYQKALSIDPMSSSAQQEFSALKNDPALLVNGMPISLLNYLRAQDFQDVIEQAKKIDHLGDPFEVYLSSVLGKGKK